MLIGLFDSSPFAVSFYRRLIPAALSDDCFAQERLVSEAIRLGICMSLFQPLQHAAIIAS